MEKIRKKHKIKKIRNKKIKKVRKNLGNDFF